MTAAAPTDGVTYRRYWNIAPVGTRGVVIAVIVRWKEGADFRRTVVVGTVVGDVMEKKRVGRGSRTRPVIIDPPLLVRK